MKMAIVAFLFVLGFFCQCCLSGQVMNRTCSRVVYIYSYDFVIIIKSSHWHVVQSVNDLYCVCYAVVQFDNTNNTNSFY